MTGQISRRRLLGGAGLCLLAGTSGVRAAAGNFPRRLLRDPEGLLELPEGYSYRVLQKAGDAMSDGYKVPARCDGMGCFVTGDGSLVLMRNHELTEGWEAHGPCRPGQPPPAEAYDKAAPGGVTRVVLDPDSLVVKSSNLVLGGTYWNCAGGLSPWGWLSCEETTQAGHGYVFVCDPEAPRVAPARRIAGYGRFRHEAATVHPETLVAYLTEDRSDSCFYRFVPADRKAPFEGSLQALRVRGKPRFDLSYLRPGESLPVDWVPIGQPDSPHDDVRLQAQAQGAALVRRGEGLWRNGDDLYICATAGGPLQLGQILRLQTTGGERIELVAQSTNSRELEMPDNITVAPSGHVYMAEDGFNGNYLRRLSLDGRIVDFARNAHSDGEFAGPCFAPDGKTLFVNLQAEGMTLAIRGPFERELEVDAQLRRAETTAPGEPDLRPVRGVASGLAVIALAALARKRRAQASTNT